MTGRSPPWELSEMGKYCGSRERSNPDDAREEVIPTGSKAVREEEDGIGSGSLKDRPIFSLGRFSLRTILVLPTSYGRGTNRPIFLTYEKRP
jgi:hypothetical protein